MKLQDLSIDYELKWPVSVFRAEALALIDTDSPTGLQSWADLLLREAFVSEIPANDLQKKLQPNPWGPSPSTPRPEDLTSDFLVSLVSLAPDLAKLGGKRPFYAQRMGVAPLVPAPWAGKGASHRLAIGLTVGDLLANGYFQQSTGSPCVDGKTAQEVDVELGDDVRRVSGMDNLWPLQEGLADHDDSLMLTLLEVLDVLVARPRRRSKHGEQNCGWHYEDHSRRAGQLIYRWRVNKVLEEHNYPLRLAESGEDAGLLVRHVDDSRTELVAQVVRGPKAEDNESVEHAIALFRRRGATRDDKRSACLTLARILESHRKTLLKKQLRGEDEGLLFQLANKWDLRHSRDDQYVDYGIEFVDWIFWQYLATVELINRLVERRDSGDES